MGAQVSLPAIEKWSDALDEGWIRTLGFAPYYPKKIDLNRCDHLTLLSDVAMIPRHHRAHMFLCRERVLHQKSMVWEAAIVKLMFGSGMFNCPDAEKEMW